MEVIGNIHENENLLKSYEKLKSFCKLENINEKELSINEKYLIKNSFVFKVYIFKENVYSVFETIIKSICK